MINTDKEVSVAEFQQELEGLISTTQGAIFTALHRLEEGGLVTLSKTAPVPVRAGKARNIYNITELGRHAVLEAVEARKVLDVLRGRKPSIPARKLRKPPPPAAKR